VVANKASSYLLQVIQGQSIPDPNNPAQTLIRAMPPNGHLSPDIIVVFTRWVMNGMPQTAADAAKLSVKPTPPAAPTP
jgi:hypothetical protein